MSKLRKKSLLPKQLRHWCKKHGFYSEGNSTAIWTTRSWIPSESILQVDSVTRSRSRCAYSQDYVFKNKYTGRRIRFLAHLEKEFSQGKRKEFEPNRTEIACKDKDFDRWANSVVGRVETIPKTYEEFQGVIRDLYYYAAQDLDRCESQLISFKICYSGRT